MHPGWQLAEDGVLAATATASKTKTLPSAQKHQPKAACMP
jgi:hypothetical protein